MGAPRGVSLAGHLPLPLGSGHVPWPQLQALIRYATKSGEMPFTCFSCFLSILPSWLGDRQCGWGARSASLACPLRPAGLGRSPTLSLSRFGGRGCGHRSQEQEITPKGDKACNPKWVGFQDQSPWGMRRGGERLGGPRPPASPPVSRWLARLQAGRLGCGPCDPALPWGSRGCLPPPNRTPNGQRATTASRRWSRQGQSPSRQCQARRLPALCWARGRFVTWPLRPAQPGDLSCPPSALGAEGQLCPGHRPALPSLGHNLSALGHRCVPVTSPRSGRSPGHSHPLCRLNSG